MSGRPASPWGEHAMLRRAILGLWDALCWGPGCTTPRLTKQRLAEADGGAAVQGVAGHGRAAGEPPWAGGTGGGRPGAAEV